GEGTSTVRGERRAWGGAATRAGVAGVGMGTAPATPSAKAAAGALVKMGLALPLATDSVKLCTAGVPTPLAAVNVSGYEPALPAAGVPVSVAVPLPLSVNVTPAGNAPVSVITTGKVPVVVIVNELTAPTTKLVTFALVIVGAPPLMPPTVSVKFCVPVFTVPFDAVNTSG